MRLLEDFVYIDLKGQQWCAPKGTVVDGGSIPKIFWTVIDPFIGDYRNATIIHDYLCQSKIAPSKTVHKLFNEMMKQDGTPAWKRIPMARAVEWFGPRF